MSIADHEYYQRWYWTVAQELKLVEPNGEVSDRTRDLLERAWERGLTTVGAATRFLAEYLRLEIRR